MFPGLIYIALWRFVFLLVSVVIRCFPLVSCRPISLPSLLSSLVCMIGFHLPMLPLNAHGPLSCTPLRRLHLTSPHQYNVFIYIFSFAFDHGLVLTYFSLQPYPEMYNSNEGWNFFAMDDCSLTAFWRLERRKWVTLWLLCIICDIPTH